ncbi:MAG: hypothetical protein AAFO96_28345, partial [Bacteroidota bacterium]
MSHSPDLLESQDEKSGDGESPALERSIDDIDNELLLIQQRFEALNVERRRLSGLPDAPAASPTPLQLGTQLVQQGGVTSTSSTQDIKQSFKPVIPRWDGQRSTWPGFKMRLIYYFRASGLYDALTDPNCNDQRSHMVMHVLMTVTSNTIYFTTVET